MKGRAIVPGNPGHHAVQFYSDETRLCVSVADFLADGIAARQPIVMIATPAHRQIIINELKGRKFDLSTLLDSENVLLLDAQKTLDAFMVDGHPDPLRFRTVIGEGIERVCRHGDNPVVRAYGEMVDVLWRRGDCQAAIELEILWNDLGRRYSFSLMCGYAMGSFYKNNDHADICAQHTHVHNAVA